MALEGLKYLPEGQVMAQEMETRSGMPIYAGTAVGFEDWHFRILGKLAVQKKKDLKSFASKVVEGLRGNGLTVAQNVGNARLSKDDGVDELISAMRDYTTPLKELEASEFEVRSSSQRRSKLGV